jgi:GNAT superfamily N-acetyltransferase
LLYSVCSVLWCSVLCAVVSTFSAIPQTKTMIASKLCIGIYRRQEDGSHKRKRTAGSREWEEGEGAQGELVSWCMIYKYGALGMLFTQPEHRGKGLAKAAVRALLLLLRESPTDMRCPPFCYIERDNDASRALFISLGFLRIDDVLWAGMRYKDAY